MRTSPPNPLSHHTPVPRERGNSAAGYNLVMLMVLLTVLNIAVAASLPAWSGMIRREKEEELVFRGLQYAEAIRVFQNRFQRPPIRLQELIEVEPRSIRRLWKDPMTDDGKWALIPLQGPPTVEMQQQQGRQEEKGVPEGKDENGREDGEDTSGDGGFGGPKKGDEVQIGPLKGVHSKSRKTSFLLFNGKDHYDEWWFTVDLFTQPAQTLGGDPTQNANAGGMTMSSRWIGRPIPDFLQPRQGTGLPDDQDSKPGSLPVGGGPGGGGKGGRPRGGTGKPG